MRYLAILFVVWLSCSSDRSLESVRVYFRMIPCDEIVKMDRDSPGSLARFYGVTSNLDSADVFLSNKLDSFVCRLLNDPSFEALLKQYDPIVLNFLKETDATLKLNDNGITDANNAGSTEHFSYSKYAFHFSNGNVFVERNGTKVDGGKIEEMKNACN